MSVRTDLRHRVRPGDPGTVLELLTRIAPLDTAALIEVLDKGGVWLTRAGGRLRRKTLRVRDGSTAIHAGDRIDLHHDPRVLAMPVPEAIRIDDRGRYSAWFKPAGMLTQGTPYGDHASLARWIERTGATTVLVVHRIDRETPGVVVVAHERRAAAALSAQFREGTAIKRYRAVVVGDLARGLGRSGVLDAPLDGKRAVTRFRVVRHDAVRDRTVVELVLDTGRTHQIRRHLDGAGFPVEGDPRYGRGNKNRAGMRLAAVALTVRCPVTVRTATFTVPPGAIPWVDDDRGC